MLNQRLTKEVHLVLQFQKIYNNVQVRYNLIN